MFRGVTTSHRGNQEICTNIKNWVKEHPQLTANILLVVGAIGLLLTTLGPILIAIGTAITTFIAFQAGMADLSVAATLIGTTVFDLVAPVLDNTKIGELVLSYDNTNVLKLSILTAETVRKKEILDYIIEITKDFSSYLEKVI